jgi:hypothetical protein
LLAALSAGDVYFNFLFDSGNLRRGDSGQTIVLGVLAGLATLGFVLQTLVVKENLLAHGPDELSTAIDASDGSIREFRCLAIRRLLQLNIWHAVHLPAGLRQWKVGRPFTVVTSKKLTRRPNERCLAYEFSACTKARPQRLTYMTMRNLCQAIFCEKRGVKLPTFDPPVSLIGFVP